MKTLTLLVFAISCSLSQLPGSLGYWDVIRRAYPSQLSSAAKKCLNPIVVQMSMFRHSSDYNCFEIIDGLGFDRRFSPGVRPRLSLKTSKIDSHFRWFYYLLSKAFNLDSVNAKAAGACLTQHRNDAKNLTSCWSRFVEAKSEAYLKKVYDEYLFPGLCGNPLAGQIINCQRQKDPYPDNYKYQFLSTNGVNCATNVFGNPKQPQELDKVWGILLTEFGYYSHAYNAATWPVRYCFHDPSGELMKEAAKPKDQRFTNKENCIKKYVGVSGLKDLVAIINRLAFGISTWADKLGLIKCALKE